MMDGQLRIALKEWGAVCGALESGRQIILLRKGGIYESAGEFEIEHPEFFLFPSYLHQKLQQIKPPDRGLFEARSDEPQQVKLSAVGRITDIISLHRREQMDAIDQEHIWLPPLIDMRFNYRPENPLYLLLVRTYQLADPITIDNTPAYAGCKSWVPLLSPLPTAGAAPVLDEQAYQHRRNDIFARIGHGGRHS